MSYQAADPVPLRASDVPAEQWANGLGRTWVLARDPSPEYLWRLSVAEISRSAAFSTFPGYDRTLLMATAADLALIIDGNRIILRWGDVIRFGGESTVTSETGTTPVHALNLITRRGHRLGALSPTRIDGAIRHPGSGQALLVLLSGRLTGPEFELTHAFDTVILGRETAVRAHDAFVVRAEVKLDTHQAGGCPKSEGWET
jgi:environmental stress-induced protein Ves